ncbi:MAG: hypothetical protein Q8N14_03580 [Candidatus Omnitrophota bacterium]|nr:hypothetical protein [Candidatus Omnitrophota bacterium]
MKKIFLVIIIFLAAITISSCATDGGDTGGYEKPSGSHGSHH